MSRFVLSGHHIDEGLTPIFRKLESEIVTATVINNSALGTFVFGGWIFPIDGSADRGHIKVGVRDDLGDTILVNDEYAAAIDPPDYVLKVRDISGPDNFALGAQGFIDRVTVCSNIANGGRVTSPAGVPLVFERTQTIVIMVASGPNTCPGVADFFIKQYVLKATFSG